MAKSSRLPNGQSKAVTGLIILAKVALQMKTTVILAMLLAIAALAYIVQSKPSISVSNTGSNETKVSAAESMPRAIVASEQAAGKSDQFQVAPESYSDLHNPLDYYNRYNEQAARGDAVATIVIIETLLYCQNYGSDNYEESIRATALPQHVIDADLRRYEWCRPLADSIENMDEQLEQFSRLLAESQHPLFLIRLNNDSDEVKRERLIDVLMADYPDPILYKRPFMEMVRFHQENDSPTSEYHEEAWLLLWCDVTWLCDSAAHRRELRTKTYHPHQYEEIEAIEASIRHGIENKDPIALGLR